MVLIMQHRPIGRCLFERSVCQQYFSRLCQLHIQALHRRRITHHSSWQGFEVQHIMYERRLLTMQTARRSLISMPAAQMVEGLSIRHLSLETRKQLMCSSCQPKSDWLPISCQAGFGWLPKAVEMKQADHRGLAKMLSRAANCVCQLAWEFVRAPQLATESA